MSAAEKFPNALRWGWFTSLAQRAAFFDALSTAAHDSGGVIVRVVTTPSVYSKGASCVVLFTDSTHQRAWFHCATPRSGRVYIVWGAFGYGPLERSKNTFWIGDPETSGILRVIPTWAWDAKFPETRDSFLR